ncbi:MAG: HyaD/HybD family hydrogenase maturation endopeptidase [Gammaproteobacteria bacterium]
MDHTQVDTLVLGIGNILWADEGFGIRAVEALNAEYRLPEDVCVMDGGTQGLFLLPWVRNASRLLILDAIDYGLAPGEIRVIRDDDVPQYLGAKKMSMHQTGFQEVLVSAQMLGEFPKQLALIGVQPEHLDDYGGSLRPCVKARIPEAVDFAIDILKEWGIAIKKREHPPELADQISPDALEMTAYELGRPT